MVWNGTVVIHPIIIVLVSRLVICFVPKSCVPCSTPHTHNIPSQHISYLKHLEHIPYSPLTAHPKLTTHSIHVLTTYHTPLAYSQLTIHPILTTHSRPPISSPPVLFHKSTMMYDSRYEQCVASTSV